MPEHTLRNKTSSTPLLSLAAPVLERMRAARPEAASLALEKLKRDYQQVAGKSVSLDYDQRTLLTARLGADERGMWTSSFTRLPPLWHRVQSAFEAGFLAGTLSRSVAEDLDVADAFYALLETQLPPA